MKLNKTEMEILAKRIRDNLRIKAGEAQERLNDVLDHNNKQRAIEIQRGLNKLPFSVKSYITGEVTNDNVVKAFAKITDISVILVKLRNKQQQEEIFLPGGRHGSTREIYEELVISQIGCTDTGILQDQVTSKFIN